MVSTGHFWYQRGDLVVWRALQVEDMGLDQVEFFPAKAYRELPRGPTPKNCDEMRQMLTGC